MQINTRNHRTVHLDTNKSKGTACSKKWYGCKWAQETMHQYTYTQIKVKEQLVIRNDMDVNEHKPLLNITLTHKLEYEKSL
jgi:hypothetical protein